MGILWEIRHLIILLIGIVAGGIGFQAVRTRLIPETFGEQGPYRTAVLKTIMDQPSFFQADAVCHECHDEVREERADSLHVNVACVHCHGPAVKHVAQARKAEKDGSAIDPPQEWDGKYPSAVDLYKSKDRRSCLVCHESVIGMPEDFKKIEVAAHLEDMGAENPESREVCAECHGNHNTAAM